MTKSEQYIAETVKKFDEEFSFYECAEVGASEVSDFLSQSLHELEEKVRENEVTLDGYKIVYISDYFYNLIETELDKISQFHHNQKGLPSIGLRDAVGMVEFRRLDQLTKEGK
jgi:hypothetical protein